MLSLGTRSYLKKNQSHGSEVCCTKLEQGGTKCRGVQTDAGQKLPSNNIKNVTASVFRIMHGVPKCSNETRVNFCIPEDLLTRTDSEFQDSASRPLRGGETDLEYKKPQPDLKNSPTKKYFLDTKSSNASRWISLLVPHDTDIRSRPSGPKAQGLHLEGARISKQMAISNLRR